MSVSVVSVAVIKKIREIMSRVVYVQKNGQINFQGTNYRVLTEEKLTSVIRPHLIELGLIVLPEDIETVKSEWVTDKKYYTEIKVMYRIVDAETGEYISVPSRGAGVDSQDKAAAKAQTMAFKYLFLRMFAIASGEDPDHICSAELDQIQEQMKAKEDTAKAEWLDYAYGVLNAAYEKGLTWENDIYAVVRQSLGKEFVSFENMSIDELSCTSEAIRAL